MSGTVQKVLVCEPAPDQTGSVCGDGFAVVVMKAYVLHPAQASNFEPVDRVEAAGVFSAAFGAVLMFFLLGRSIGAVVNMFRNRF